MQHELLPIGDILDHPDNYQEHPDDQLEHLVRSIEAYGIYRPIIVSADNRILAGHGVVKAARRMGLTEVPVFRVGYEHTNPMAIRLLIGDNEISHLAERNDRLLGNLLKSLNDNPDVGLLGTGYDQMMLSNLLLATRPASEIPSTDEAREWVGLPAYEPKLDVSIRIQFDSEEDRSRFNELIGLEVDNRDKGTWWPVRDRSQRHLMDTQFILEGESDDADTAA